MSAYQLLLDRMENERKVLALIEALSPEAAAPLEALTSLAVAWRKYVEAERLAKGEIIDEAGDVHPPEIVDAIHVREEIEAIILGMPSGSPAGALVRIMWAVFYRVTDARDNEGKLREDYDFNSWEWVLFEAMLDLLQPGVLARIAAGLAGVTSERIDRVGALFQQWETARMKFFKTANGLEEAEADATTEEVCDLERQMSITPATTLSSVIAKVRVVRAELDSGSATDDRDKRMLEGVIDDLERLARRERD